MYVNGLRRCILCGMFNVMILKKKKIKKTWRNISLKHLLNISLSEGSVTVFSHPFKCVKKMYEGRSGLCCGRRINRKLCGKILTYEPFY